jgi:hypothetical protein
MNPRCDPAGRYSAPQAPRARGRQRSLWICGQRKSVAHIPTGQPAAARIKLEGSGREGLRPAATSRSAIFARILTAIHSSTHRVETALVGPVFSTQAATEQAETFAALPATLEGRR